MRKPFLEAWNTDAAFVRSFYQGVNPLVRFPPPWWLHVCFNRWVLSSRWFAWCGAWTRLGRNWEITPLTSRRRGRLLADCFKLKGDLIVNYFELCEKLLNGTTCKLGFGPWNLKISVLRHRDRALIYILFITGSSWQTTRLLPQFRWCKDVFSMLHK